MAAKPLNTPLSAAEIAALCDGVYHGADFQALDVSTDSRRLQAGENVALVSDAGTPLVSDPGALLTRLAHAADIRVSPLPGASSVIAALSASGLPADRFTFAGFIPAKAGERQRFLDDYRTAKHTTIFFEAPHRISDTLATMAETFDSARPLVITRELSKQFEQIAHPQRPP